MAIYTMKYRPVSTVTLPRGVTYELVAIPRGMPGCYNRPDLLLSRCQFGEFTTSRPLTAEEMRDFEIINIGE